MSSKRFLDTSLLQDDIMTYNNNRFYEITDQLVGQDISDLIKLRAIPNIPSLLLENDIFEVLKLDCDDVNDIRSRITFKLCDGKFVVKEGFKSSYNYLIQLFKKKCDEHSKATHSKDKRLQIQTTLPSDNAESISLSSIAITPSNISTTLASPTETQQSYKNDN
ncbi:unnamed protein product [Didymodactylos carnosus]|uniref:Uncharacterized protein n=1 Tax=Didymodactylos carnosus TaxID=1234261 RepID=A0A8S2YJJ8_9BILA|nr:unnamed protein product [Didymodactylos carnosus]